jgi:hypothetical protein
MSDRLVDGQSAVDRPHLTFLAGSVTAGAALGTLGRGRSVSGEIAHMLCLDPPAQLLAQFVGSTLDDRVMRDPHDGALHPIKCYRNFRRLAQELVKFFLEIGRRPIHGLTPFMPRWNPPKSPGAAIYHKIPEFSY